MQIWRRIALVLALGTGFGAPAAAGDPDDVPTVRIYVDWRLACPPSTTKAATCMLEQDILDAKTHKELARITIFNIKGMETLLITMPFNVLLEPGIGLDFSSEEEPAIFNYEICDKEGCVVRIPFSGDLAERFAHAPAPRILFAGLDGKPLGLPYSMKGFDDAHAAYRRFQSRLGVGER